MPFDCAISNNEDSSWVNLNKKIVALNDFSVFSIFDSVQSCTNWASHEFYFVPNSSISQFNVKIIERKKTKILEHCKFHNFNRSTGMGIQLNSSWSTLKGIISTIIFCQS